jgi:hypothetical protein
MAWRPGQSGNPGGHLGEKVYRDALRMALHQIDPVTQKRKLRLVAAKAVALALKGEGWAIQHIADRIDGRAAVEATITVNNQQDMRAMSDEALQALINKQKAEDEKPTLLQ